MTKEEVVQLFDRYIELKKKNTWSAQAVGFAIKKVKINANLNTLEIEEFNDIVKKLSNQNDLKFLSRAQLIAISDDDNFRDKVPVILINL